MRVWIVSVIIMLSSVARGQNRTDSLLIQLDKTIVNRSTFDKAKINRINILKARVSAIQTGQRYDLYSAICDEYKKFVYDSASIYVRKLQQEALLTQDPSRIALAKVKFGFILVSSGMFKEALDSLLAINHDDIEDSVKIQYYSVLARTYYDLVDFNRDNYFSERYIKIGGQYIDSAIRLCAHNSVEYLALRVMKAVRENDLDQALHDQQYMLSNFKLNDPDLAIATSTLGFIYLGMGEEEKSIEMLIRASMADIRSSTKETLAILNLAELIYAKGDVSRAYEYVKLALDDANFYGARHRKIQVAAIFPIIEGNRLDTAEHQRKLLFIYAILITLLSLLVIGFTVIIFRQNKTIKLADQSIQEANRSLHGANTQLQEVNRHLLEANKIKEEYIGYYFNNNSDYLSKISNFKQAIENKLMAKKFDDIRFVVSNINLKKEREELYVSFDKVFLKLFPDFVSTFNSYFSDDDKIVLKDGQLLNTELRIFALIRLGIHDTEKIAKILDYSINTIYNYKARIKSRSLIPNEEFETRIMSINAG